MTRGIVALVALGLGVAMVLGGSPEAAAKGNSWIVTGGELGGQAVHVGFWEFEDGIEYPLGNDAVLIAAPAEVPVGAFEFYLHGQLEYVAARVRAGEPSFVFYPEPGLLQDLREHTAAGGQWYRVAADGAASRYVAFAIDQLRAGAAYPDPITAAAATAGYFRPGTTNYGVIVSRWRDHVVVGTPRAILDDDALAISREIVELLSGEPAGFGGDLEALQLVLGAPSWTGQVGFYAPPELGRTGRLWVQGYPSELERDAPYYATSPEFDALVQQSIEAGAAHELELQRSAEESRARIRAANEERMARVAREEQAARLAFFRAIETELFERRADAGSDGRSGSAVSATVASLAAALLLAGVGVGWAARPKRR